MEDSVALLESSTGWEGMFLTVMHITYLGFVVLPFAVEQISEQVAI